MSLQRVGDLLKTHFSEATDALVDKPPSSLRRGEGTEKPFFIMKIDLVGSTSLLMSKRQATYLKLAHTFLSTVDRITQDYGADAEQVEYAGDGLFAYFPATADAAERVMIASFYAKAAVGMIANLGGAVGALKPQCRIVVHYDVLTVARIGPRAGSILSAIGMPIHRVAKLEKTIAPGEGRVTPEFRQQLDRRLWKFLETVYVEEQVLVPAPLPPPVPLASFGLGSDYRRNALVDLLRQPSSPPPPPPITLGMVGLFGQQANNLASLANYAPTPAPSPTYRTEKRVVGYKFNWLLLAQELK